jgi:oligopeptide/dipeptide ABC transporter ATP-binding protein
MSIFTVKDLEVVYQVHSETGGNQELRAVSGVSFTLHPGEILGIVGESGCGKSTLAKAVLGLIPVKSGTLEYKGKDIGSFNRKELFDFRKQAQIVFQDPFSSLNPRKRVASILGKPLLLHKQAATKEEAQTRVESLLEEVGLQGEYKQRFPHQFSGGQRQRIGIARALTTEPEVIVCDEAVSALDVSVQAQILNLLLDIKEKRDLSYIFISHDLSVVEFISNRIIVMYLGQIVESGKTEEIMKKPLHPYTKALLEAFPEPDPENKLTEAPLVGDVPSPINPPEGCPFHTRCPSKFDRCEQEKPILKEIEPGRNTACFLYE